MCDNECSPRYADLRKKGSGCPTCAEHGFDPTAPGLVYLMTHAPLFALKVGISTTSAKLNRVEDHEHHGWELVREWAVTTGEIARRVESRILAWWRDDLDLPPAAAKADMPQRGYSETVSMLYIEPTEALERIANEILNAEGG